MPFGRGIQPDAGSPALARHVQRRRHEIEKRAIAEQASAHRGTCRCRRRPARRSGREPRGRHRRLRDRVHPRLHRCHRTRRLSGHLRRPEQGVRAHARGGGRPQHPDRPAGGGLRALERDTAETGDPQRHARRDPHHLWRRRPSLRGGRRRSHRVLRPRHRRRQPLARRPRSGPDRRAPRRASRGRQLQPRRQRQERHRARTGGRAHRALDHVGSRGCRHLQRRGPGPGR